MPVVVAFILGGLSVVAVVLLSNAPKYETPIEIVGGFLGGLITGAFGGAITRAFTQEGASGKPGKDGAAGQDGAEGIAAKLIRQCAMTGVAGAGVATVGCVLVTSALASPVIMPPVSAGRYINAVDESNLLVTSVHGATFTISVPAGYRELTLNFQVTNSPGYSDDCINGAELLITPEYGATTAAQYNVTPDDSLSFAIPAGVRSLTLSVQFEPPDGFNDCDEEITVGAASEFSS